MVFELMNFSNSLIKKLAVNEIVKCNDITVNFGLVLTQSQAIELVGTRDYSLLENGRIEFGGGVIDKIIMEFCDSPYITMRNYAETLHELIEMFYYYKNETLDLMSDDDLIKFMHNSFDGTCQGSLELLSNRELAKMAINLHFGLPPDYSEDAVLETILDIEEEDENEEH